MVVPDWCNPGDRQTSVSWSRHKPESGNPDLAVKRIYSSSANIKSQKRHLSFSILRNQNPKDTACVGKIRIASLPFYQDAIHGFESEVMRGWEPENLQLIYGPRWETNIGAFGHSIVADIAKKGLSGSVATLSIGLFGAL